MFFGITLPRPLLLKLDLQPRAFGRLSFRYRHVSRLGVGLFNGRKSLPSSKEEERGVLQLEGRAYEALCSEASRTGGCYACSRIKKKMEFSVCAAAPVIPAYYHTHPSSFFLSYISAIGSFQDLLALQGR